MYPGYSPADHEYGKAAEEYGKAVAEARRQGIEIEHEDAEYEIGQAKGAKRKMLAALRDAHAAKGVTSGTGTRSGSEVPIQEEAKESATINGQASMGKVEEANLEGDNPYFVIDTNPTPVDVPGISFQSPKRSPGLPEAVEATKHKKAKKKHDGEMPKGEDTQQVKTEDISDQVDARVKEKKKKRKMKEEKKRKRESEGEPAAAVEGPESTAEPPHTVVEAERPKKKKKKVRHSEEPLPDRTVSKKRASEAVGGVENEEGKSKKKRKKSKEAPITGDA